MTFFSILFGKNDTLNLSNTNHFKHQPFHQPPPLSSLASPRSGWKEALHIDERSSKASMDNEPTNEFNHLNVFVNLFGELSTKDRILNLVDAGCDYNSGKIWSYFSNIYIDSWIVRPFGGTFCGCAHQHRSEIQPEWNILPSEGWRPYKTLIHLEVTNLHPKCSHDRKDWEIFDVSMVDKRVILKNLPLITKFSWKQTLTPSMRPGFMMGTSQPGRNRLSLWCKNHVQQLN